MKVFELSYSLFEVVFRLNQIRLRKLSRHELVDDLGEAQGGLGHDLSHLGLVSKLDGGRDE